jgi:hypothetical protein
MKKTILLISMIVATVTLNAQVFTEYFQDASPDMNLEDYNDWYVSYKPADALGVSPIIRDETLFYEGYAGSDTGLVVELDSLVGMESTTQRISTKIPTISGDSVRPIEGEKIYVAFMVSIGPYSKTSWRDFFTWEGSPFTSMWARGRIFALVDGNRTDLQFGVSKNSSDGSVIVASDIIAGGVEAYHLLVLVYESIAGDANDVVHLYVNPDPTKGEDEQTIKLTSVDNQTDYSTGTIIKINVRQRGVGAKIGGIRLGRNWEEVLQGVEEPTSLNQMSVRNNDIRSYRNEIITGGPGFLRVYDISGRNVLNHITGGRLETSLQNGIYIVRFEDLNGEISTGKISLNVK